MSSVYVSQFKKTKKNVINRDNSKIGNEPKTKQTNKDKDTFNHDQSSYHNPQHFFNTALAAYLQEDHPRLRIKNTGG